MGLKLEFLQGLAGLYCASLLMYHSTGTGVVWGAGGGGAHGHHVVQSLGSGGVGVGGGPLNPAQHDRDWPLGFWVCGSVLGILAGFGLRSRVRFRDTM